MQRTIIYFNYREFSEPGFEVCLWKAFVWRAMLPFALPLYPNKNQDTLPHGEWTTTKQNRGRAAKCALYMAEMILWASAVSTSKMGQ